jgi:uncharacterized oxidoreductase
MDLASNTVLITGGSTGIGLALAKRFLQSGSDVIVCGRREQVLQEARAAHPGLGIHVCDVSNEQDRVALFKSAVADRPRLNVLVNNAGIQHRRDLTDATDWARTRQEIAINLDAPVHLSTLFIPHLLTRQRPVIINVTSGLAFVPLASAPIYCATKAALHSFTLSLRHQLADTPIQVIEIAPPAVDTDLGGAGQHTFGVPLDEFAEAAVAGLQRGDLEITYGFSAETSRASRDQLDAIFSRMNQPPQP